MERIRFSIIGTGWRSEFYVRIALKATKYFELLAIKVRNKEKEEHFKKMKVRCVYTEEELLEDKPDFVVVCVDKAHLFEVTLGLLEKGINVFCETPLSVEKEKLLYMMDNLDKIPGKLVITEQYPFLPLYGTAKSVIAEGLMGDVQSVHLSCCHDYHAIALARYFLDEKERGELIFIDKCEESYLETGNRGGAVEDGECRKVKRKRFLYRFKDGKTFTYDFTSDQYHSAFNKTHFEIRGEKGYICDHNFYGKDIKGFFGESESSRLIFEFSCDGTKGYAMPYYTELLEGDEAAIAYMMHNFKGYLKGDEKLVYPPEEAMLDAIIATEVY